MTEVRFDVSYEQIRSLIVESRIPGIKSVVYKLRIKNNDIQNVGRICQQTSAECYIILFSSIINYQ